MAQQDDFLKNSGLIGLLDRAIYTRVGGSAKNSEAGKGGQKFVVLDSRKIQKNLKFFKEPK